MEVVYIDTPPVLLHVDGRWVVEVVHGDTLVRADIGNGAWLLEQVVEKLAAPALRAPPGLYHGNTPVLRRDVTAAEAAEALYTLATAEVTHTVENGIPVSYYMPPTNPIEWPLDAKLGIVETQALSADELRSRLRRPMKSDI